MSVDLICVHPFLDGCRALCTVENNNIQSFTIVNADYLEWMTNYDLCENDIQRTIYEQNTDNKYLFYSEKIIHDAATKFNCLETLETIFSMDAWKYNNQDGIRDVKLLNLDSDNPDASFNMAKLNYIRQNLNEKSIQYIFLIENKSTEDCNFLVESTILAQKSEIVEWIAKNKSNLKPIGYHVSNKNWSVCFYEDLKILLATDVPTHFLPIKESRTYSNRQLSCEWFYHSTEGNLNHILAISKLLLATKNGSLQLMKLLWNSSASQLCSFHPSISLWCWLYLALLNKDFCIHEWWYNCILYHSITVMTRNFKDYIPSTLQTQQSLYKTIFSHFGMDYKNSLKEKKKRQKIVLDEIDFDHMPELESICSEEEEDTTKISLSTKTLHIWMENKNIEQISKTMMFSLHLLYDIPNLWLNLSLCDSYASILTEEYGNFTTVQPLIARLHYWSRILGFEKPTCNIQMNDLKRNTSDKINKTMIFKGGSFPTSFQLKHHNFKIYERVYKHFKTKAIEYDGENIEYEINRQFGFLDVYSRMLFYKTKSVLFDMAFKLNTSPELILKEIIYGISKTKTKTNQLYITCVYGTGIYIQNSTNAYSINFIEGKRDSFDHDNQVIQFNQLQNYELIQSDVVFEEIEYQLSKKHWNLAFENEFKLDTDRKTPVAIVGKSSDLKHSLIKPIASIKHSYDVHKIWSYISFKVCSEMKEVIYDKIKYFIQRVQIPLESVYGLIIKNNETNKTIQLNWSSWEILKSKRFNSSKEDDVELLKALFSIHNFSTFFTNEQQSDEDFIFRKAYEPLLTTLYEKTRDDEKSNPPNVEQSLIILQKIIQEYMTLTRKKKTHEVLFRPGWFRGCMNLHSIKLKFEFLNNGVYLQSSLYGTKTLLPLEMFPFEHKYQLTQEHALLLKPHVLPSNIEKIKPLLIYPNQYDSIKKSSHQSHKPFDAIARVLCSIIKSPMDLQSIFYSLIKSKDSEHLNIYCFDQSIYLDIYNGLMFLNYVHMSKMNLEEYFTLSSICHRIMNNENQRNCLDRFVFFKLLDIEVGNEQKKYVHFLIHWIKNVIFCRKFDRVDPSLNEIDNQWIEIASLLDPVAYWFEHIDERKSYMWRIRHNCPNQVLEWMLWNLQNTLYKYEDISTYIPYNTLFDPFAFEKQINESKYIMENEEVDSLKKHIEFFEFLTKQKPVLNCFLQLLNQRVNEVERLFENHEESCIQYNRDYLKQSIIKHWIYRSVYMPSQQHSLDVALSNILLLASSFYIPNSCSIIVTNKTQEYSTILSEAFITWKESFSFRIISKNSQFAYYEDRRVEDSEEIIQLTKDKKFKIIIIHSDIAKKMKNCQSFLHGFHWMHIIYDRMSVSWMQENAYFLSYLSSTYKTIVTLDDVEKIIDIPIMENLYFPYSCQDWMEQNKSFKPYLPCIMKYKNTNLITNKFVDLYCNMAYNERVCHDIFHRIYEDSKFSDNVPEEDSEALLDLWKRASSNFWTLFTEPLNVSDVLKDSLIQAFVQYNSGLLFSELTEEPFYQSNSIEPPWNTKEYDNIYFMDLKNTDDNNVLIRSSEQWAEKMAELLEKKKQDLISFHKKIVDTKDNDLIHILLSSSKWKTFMILNRIILLFKRKEFIIINKKAYSKEIKDSVINPLFNTIKRLLTSEDIKNKLSVYETNFHKYSKKHSLYTVQEYYSTFNLSSENIRTVFMNQWFVYSSNDCSFHDWIELSFKKVIPPKPLKTKKRKHDFDEKKEEIEEEKKDEKSSKSLKKHLYMNVIVFQKFQSKWRKGCSLALVWCEVSYLIYLYKTDHPEKLKILESYEEGLMIEIEEFCKKSFVKLYYTNRLFQIMNEKILGSDLVLNSLSSPKWKCYDSVLENNEIKPTDISMKLKNISCTEKICILCKENQLDYCFIMLKDFMVNEKFGLISTGGKKSKILFSNYLDNICQSNHISTLCNPSVMGLIKSKHQEEGENFGIVEMNGMNGMFNSISLFNTTTEFRILILEDTFHFLSNQIQNCNTFIDYGGLSVNELKSSEESLCLHLKSSYPNKMVSIENCFI
jgi:hypothetical protein